MRAVDLGGGGGRLSVAWAKDLQRSGWWIFRLFPDGAYSCFLPELHRFIMEVCSTPLL